MKTHRAALAVALLGLIVFSVWIAVAQDREDEERAAIQAVATKLINAALARDIETVKASADFPLTMIEGMGGRTTTLKEEELEGLLQMVYVPMGITLEIQKAQILLMGSVASAQLQLGQPGGPDLGLSGRVACILVKKDGEWKVKTAAYYGY